MSFLILRGLALSYGGVPALDDVSLSVEPGTRLAVVGPSGSGKSTLLRVLAGFEAPDRGQVLLGGDLIVDGPAIVPAHRRAIGLVAQEGALFPHLTVSDNIGFGVGRWVKGRAGWIEELAGMVGLDAAMLRRKPDALSGGQQQRVALARALACKPRLMLLDEPFSALDTGLRAETRHAVAAMLARTGVTTVLVTHDQEEALSFAHQVAVLQNGRLLQTGTPRDLYLRPNSEQVARFLGEAIIVPGEAAGGQVTCALGQFPIEVRADGPVRVMLRQEQVALGAAASGPSGGVEQVEFAGGACTVLLVLDDGTRLALRVAQNAAPGVGERVGLTIGGTVHLV